MGSTTRMLVPCVLLESSLCRMNGRFWTTHRLKVESGKFITRSTRVETENRVAEWSSSSSSNSASGRKGVMITVIIIQDCKLLRFDHAALSPFVTALWQSAAFAWYEGESNFHNAIEESTGYRWVARFFVSNFCWPFYSRSSIAD